MYTQCPHCQTIFGVSEAHLSAAFGRVRCGQCRGQFNAKRHLLDTIPEQSIEAGTPPSPHPRQAQPTATVSSETVAADNKPNLPEATPAEQTDHVDPSDPDEAPETGISAPIEADEEKVTLTDRPLTTIKQAVAENNPEKEELDAIFAALDHRLQELSADTADAFIKPSATIETDDTNTNHWQATLSETGNQTEEDAEAGSETILAGGESIKPDTVNRETLPENAMPLETLLAEADVEWLGNEDIENQTGISKQQIDDEYIAESADEAEDFNFAGNAEEIEDTLSPSMDQQDTTPAFEQEDLPFALQDDLAANPVPPRRWQKTAAQFGIIIILLLAIGFQLALFRNVELAHKLPVLKPYLTTFCQYLPCRFTGLRDVDQIQLTSRDVRTTTLGKNSILISAIFVNNAHFDQPYPDILITLSDLASTVVAQRRFTPEDYLAKTSAFQLMKSGKPVHITLEVLDPGNDAVNFQFKFL